MKTQLIPTFTYKYYENTTLTVKMKIYFIRFENGLIKF